MFNDKGSRISRMCLLSKTFTNFCKVKRMEGKKKKWL